MTSSSAGWWACHDALAGGVKHREVVSQRGDLMVAVCDGCGFRWPCPAAEALEVPELSVDELTRLHEVDVGWVVACRRPESMLDGESGVVVDRVRGGDDWWFVTFDVVAGVPVRRVLPRGRCEPRLVSEPNWNGVAALVRGLCRFVAAKKRGHLSDFERDCLVAAGRLEEVVPRFGR